LCNDALDDRHSLPIIEPLAKPLFAPTEPKPAERPTPAKAVGKPDALREAAVAVLRNAAQAWADGEDDAPTPDEVWDRLRDLIRDQVV